jgi:hypothetical protein
VDKNNDKSQSLIKLAPFAVAAVLLLIFITISQVPLSGQRAKGPTTPEAPALKDNQTSESFGKSYKNEDGQAASVATSEATSPLPGLPKDNPATAHSYFSSPRMVSARNSIHDPSTRDLSARYQYSSNQPTRDQSISSTINPALAQALLSQNNPPAEDLLELGYMDDDKIVYDPAFGSARDRVKTQ